MNEMREFKLAMNTVEESHASVARNASNARLQQDNMGQLLRDAAELLRRADSHGLILNITSGHVSATVKNRIYTVSVYPDRSLLGYLEELKNKRCN